MEHRKALVAFPQHHWPFPIAVAGAQSLSSPAKTLRSVADYLKPIFWALDDSKGAPMPVGLRCARVDLPVVLASAALALGPHREQDYLGAVAAARLNAALALIKENFSKPDLTVTEIARCQNISPRHLQRLMETTGRSFATYVNDLRLDHAYALLRERRDDPRRISDIALQAGFSDISHFNRLFRLRFGATPSDVRHGARRGLDA